MTRVAFIVNILRLQGIEVGRATSEVKLKEGTFPAGSLRDQARSAVWAAGEDPAGETEFPGSELTTYDDTGWTMGLMAHAKVVESADKTCCDAPTTLIDKFDPKGTISGGGSGCLRGGRQWLEQSGHAALSPEGRRGASE